MRKLTFTNSANAVIVLDDTLYGITKLDGVASPTGDLQEQKAPYQDGSSLIDFLLNPREITVEGVIAVGLNLALRYEYRKTMATVLNPKLGLGTLAYENDYGSWQINAIPQGLIFNSRNANEGNQGYQISFYCPDPYWEATNYTQVNVFGNSGSFRTTINISGDVSVPLKAAIRKTSKELLISNVTTGKSIRLSGVKFGDETLEVDTTFGNKSVKSLSHAVSATLGNVISSIAFSKDLGLYCAVGSAGLIITSPDQKTWTTRSSVSFGDFTRVRWIGGYFVAVNLTGELYYSSDARTWTRKLFSGSPSIYDVIYYPEGATYKWLAVTSTGFIYRATSVNGTWSSYNIGVATELYGIEKNGANLVIVGAAGVIRSSPDGVTWSPQTSGTANALRSVEFAVDLNIWIAVGAGGTIITSPDFITWTPRTSGVATELRDVFYNSATLTVVVVGLSNAIRTSSNGTAYSGATWSGSADIYSAVFSPFTNLWCAVGSSGAILQSVVGTASTWTTWTYGQNITFEGCAYSPYLKKWCAVGSTYSAISVDGKTWTYTYLAGRVFSSIVWCEDLLLFVATDYNTSKVARSADGVSWTDSTTSLTSPKDIAYSKALKVFCVVGLVGKIWTSTDAITWFLHTDLLAPDDLESVAYSETRFLFVACGLNGTIRTSVDGVEWTTQTSGTTSQLTCVAYSDELAQWCVGSFGAAVFYSYDAITWTYTGVSSNAILGIAYSDYFHAWVACGVSRYLSYSYDGINFTGVALFGGSTTLYDIAWSEDLKEFLSVGDQGNLVSGPVIETYVDAIDLMDFDSEFWDLEVGDNDVLVQSDHGPISGTITYRNRYIGV